MNACPEWRERLRDQALGTPAGAELSEHLRTCPACAAALGKFRNRVGTLDAGVRELVRGVEPSPELRDRILAATVRRPLPARRVAAGGAFGLAAMATAVLLFAFLMPRGVQRDRPAPSPEMSALVDWKSPTDSLLRFATTEAFQSAPTFGEFYFHLEPVPAGAPQEVPGENHEI